MNIDKISSSETPESPLHFKKEDLTRKNIQKLDPDIHKISGKTLPKAPSSHNLFIENVEVQEDSEIDDLFAAYISGSKLEIPKDSPFKGTDLIIFRDNTPGQLPLNGIYESDFKKISTLFDEIKSGKSHIKIDDTDKDFQINVQNTILTLLTRRVGRALIEKIAYHEKEADLKIFLGGDAHYDGKNISFNYNKLFYRTATPDSGLKDVPYRHEIVLAHEMVHHLHHLETSSDELRKGISKNASLGNDFHNIEEQQTIIGLTDFVPSKTTEELEAEETFEPHDYSTLWNELNENSFLTAFGLPPRIDHLGKLEDTAQEQSEKTLALTPLQNAINSNNDSWIIEILKHKETFTEGETSFILKALFSSKLDATTMNAILDKMSQSGVDLSQTDILLLAIRRAPLNVIHNLLKHTETFTEGETSLIINELFAGGLDGTTALAILDKMSQSGVDLSQTDILFSAIQKATLDVIHHLQNNLGLQLSKSHVDQFLNQTISGEIDLEIMHNIFKDNPAFKDVNWPFLAIQVDQPGLLSALLRSGEANVNQQDVNGNTLVHLIITKGSFNEVTKELITSILKTSNFDPHLQNIEGDTPLHLIIKSQYWKFDINWYSNLPTKSVNFDIKNVEGQTTRSLIEGFTSDPSLKKMHQRLLADTLKELEKKET